MACLPDGRDGSASWHAGCGAGTLSGSRPIRPALPIETRYRRSPTTRIDNGLRWAGPPPISPFSCSVRWCVRGKGRSRARGEHRSRDGFGSGGSWRWHRRWWRGPASASVGRKRVMREAMAYGGGGGPAEYGGQPMAGAGAWRAAMRHANFGPLGAGPPGFTLRHRLQGQFPLDSLPLGLHERAVLLTLSVVRAFVGVPTTMPSADFCAVMTVLANTLSPGLPDTAQTSRGKTDRLHRTPAEFTTPALDGCGLRDHLPARPAG